MFPSARNCSANVRRERHIGGGWHDAREIEQVILLVARLALHDGFVVVFFGQHHVAGAEGKRHKRRAVTQGTKLPLPAGKGTLARALEVHVVLVSSGQNAVANSTLNRSSGERSATSSRRASPCNERCRRLQQRTGRSCRGLRRKARGEEGGWGQGVGADRRIRCGSGRRRAGRRGSGSDTAQHNAGRWQQQQGGRIPS